MNADILQPLINFGTARTLNKGRVIHFGEHVDSFFLLRKGLIKISVMNNEGKEVIKYILQPGGFFGEMSLLDNHENKNEYAIAIEDCEIVFIRAEKVKSLMKEDESLHKAINFAIGNRFKKLEERMLSMLFMDVRERVFNFLKNYVKDFGLQHGNGYQARNFLTHEDIAKLTATSRQTVTKMMSGMKKSGLIDYNTRYMKVYQ